ncbi:uncharacterized protein (DUF427 family) [Nakamurella sp. UYEF19]|uniref:DUF427 domain-containing protein n=1 Tax=Nakamurella sp. UYEF19 TaxID=1756392 RepID=UPI0033954475
MRSSLPRGVVPQTPGPGQESVWEYPRPPRLEQSRKTVVVRVGDVVLARTGEAFRVLETSHPPTWYLPLASVRPDLLRLSRHPSTTCEWKGAATYWDVLAGSGPLEAAAWSYERPTKAFRDITGHLAFDPNVLTCEVDGEVVRAQEGGFYAGWITDDVVGPFKGIPGSWGW